MPLALQCLLIDIQNNFSWYKWIKAKNRISHFPYSILSPKRYETLTTFIFQINRKYTLNRYISAQIKKKNLRIFCHWNGRFLPCNVIVLVSVHVSSRLWKAFSSCKWHFVSSYIDLQVQFMIPLFNSCENKMFFFFSESIKKIYSDSPYDLGCCVWR